MNSSMKSCKQAMLLALAKKRQKDSLEGYVQRCTNLSDHREGKYECDHVSPYTKSAGNVDAGVMIFLQDWASEDFMLKPVCAETIKWGFTPGRATNTNLIGLLENHFDLSLKKVYVTNLFPFIKPGAMNAAIPIRDMLRAAGEYGLPQLKIVSPRLAICIGLNTFRALVIASRAEPAVLPRTLLRDAIVRSPSIATMNSPCTDPQSYKQVLIWCQAHTGPLGRANAGGAAPVNDNWARMAAEFLIAGRR